MPPETAGAPDTHVPEVRFTGQLEVFYMGESPSYLLPVPEEVWRQLGSKLPIRVRMTVRGVERPLAIQARKGALPYLYFSRDCMKQTGVTANETFAVALRLETEPLGMPMPEELAVALEQDPAAAERFDSLNPGTKRGYVHWVASGKAEATRIQRAIDLQRALHHGIPPPGKLKEYLRQLGYYRER